MEIKNAQIASTMLGYEDHGILTCFLNLSYGGCVCQSVGGYSLGPKFGIQLIKEILNIVGVQQWEHLKGQHIRVKSNHEKAIAIGHLLKEFMKYYTLMAYLLSLGVRWKWKGFCGTLLDKILLAISFSILNLDGKQKHSKLIISVKNVSS